MRRRYAAAAVVVIVVAVSGCSEVIESDAGSEYGDQGQSFAHATTDWLNHSNESPLEVLRDRAAGREQWQGGTWEASHIGRCETNVCDRWIRNRGSGEGWNPSGDDWDRCPGDCDPTPETIDGTPSHEFEPADIQQAEGASSAVQDYCAGTVSEAQEAGCLSHVDDSDIP